MFIGHMLVDGNSVGFAAQQGTKLTVGDGFQVQAIFGMIKSLRVFLTSHPGFKPLVLWDGRSWRHALFADYKSNRDNDPVKVAMRDSYKLQRPHIARALRLLGIPQMMAINLEADDLAAILVKKLAEEQGEKVVLMTGDEDWLQLVGPGVSWEDHRRDKRCNFMTFEKFTGYKDAKAFVQGKALMGDTSDTIPGVGGVGEKGAPELLKTYGSVKEFLAVARGENPPKLGKKLREFADNTTGGIERYVRNLQLMDLRTDKRPAPEKMTITPGKLDVEAFTEFCREWQFRSILATINEFVEPFRSLEHEREEVSSGAA